MKVFPNAMFGMLLLSSYTMLITVSQKTPAGTERRCHKCTFKGREINNRTQCTLNTFSATNGISCKRNAYCFTEILKPVEGNDQNILLQRDCSLNMINACVYIKTKGKGDFTKCIKSCDEDQCNTDSVIDFPILSGESSTQKITSNATEAKKNCTGNGADGLKMGRTFTTVAVLQLIFNLI